MSADMHGPGGAIRHHRLRDATAALLISCSAVPSAAAAAQTSTPDPNRDIVITAPLFRDLRPERTLDEDALESYAVSTIDELLGEVDVELGDAADRPLILVNGKRIGSLSEIGSLPVEAVKSIEVLPRGAAVRAGGTSGQRVISLTLHPRTRTATLTAGEKIATDGDWDAQNGEAILTNVNGDTRANLAFRVRDEGSLLESDRNILQPDPSLPYALGGNVIAFPTNLTGEIDPLLSAAAGKIVTVASIPSGANPGLSAFAANANNAATTDLGRFRTLRPSDRNYDLTGTFAAPLTSWLTSSASLSLSRDTSRSLRGLPNALFRFTATNPASPFSRDVQIAAYGSDPLHSSARRDVGNGNITLNATLGAWIGNFNARHNVIKNVASYDGQTTFGAVTLANSVNPFATDLSGLIGTTTDRSNSRSTTDLMQLSMTGPVFALPAGPLIATMEGRVNWNRLRGESSFAGGGKRVAHRSEQDIRGALDIPLTSRGDGVLPQLGDLSATVELGHIHFSDAGSLNTQSFGVTWEPIKELRLRGSIEESGLAPSIESLAEPAVFTPGVRTFDPLTGQTVDVIQITGGQANLKLQKTIIRRLTGILSVLPRLNLQLNTEYTDSDRRNLFSSLPDQSAAIMLAFPDRFIRDGSGRLTTIDLRAVNFDSAREKRLRWGFSMSRRFGASAPAARSARGNFRVPERRSGTFLQLTANHTMVFSEKLLIRSGLDPINLLEGGAIGITGGHLRHQVDASAALTSGGAGVRLGVNWRGKSELKTLVGGSSGTLNFSPVMLVNARLFADMNRVVPHAGDWAKGFRISLDVLNVTNDRQTVRNSAGVTPLQYQKAYRDPLGRTIELEFRKVF